MVAESWSRLPGSSKRLVCISDFGDEVAEGDADEEGLAVTRGRGGLLPAALQDFEERERVLAGAEAGFHAPAGLGDAAVVLLYSFAVGGSARLLA